MMRWTPGVLVCERLSNDRCLESEPLIRVLIVLKQKLGELPVIQSLILCDEDVWNGDLDAFNSLFPPEARLTKADITDGRTLTFGQPPDPGWLRLLLAVIIANGWAMNARDESGQVVLASDHDAWLYWGEC